MVIDTKAAVFILIKLLSKGAHQQLLGTSWSLLALMWGRRKKKLKDSTSRKLFLAMVS